MDDSNTPDRENTSLFLDRNNETVVSNMTEASCYGAESVNYVEAAVPTSNLPSSRFLGSTVS